MVQVIPGDVPAGCGPGTRWFHLRRWLARLGHSDPNAQVLAGAQGFADTHAIPNIHAIPDIHAVPKQQ